ncbi:MAG: DNA repair exonuclease [Methanobacteriaceae archaeon]|jgi:DNA repair exonuclease SbcCD nuclease subunit|nr:MAG: metallophosphoesterase [Methanobacterium sp. BRmetb2]MCC7558202.1 DNA repair exonuclease [Methanobacteriaceae archaeon]
MRFVHLSDTHLGYRQYGLFEREKDFYDVFMDLTGKIIEERPDFVIHSGDFFESSRPPTTALLTVQNCLAQLKERNIPIYAIPGNHDTIMRKNALPPLVLYKNFGLKLISLRNPYYIENGIFIGGVPFNSRYFADRLKNQIQELSRKSMEYDYRILVLHQGIDKYIPYEYELKIGDIPENFNYYAFGHIHNRIIDDYGQGKLVYPGSPEIWRIDELPTYKTKGKGFYLVDTDGDLPDIQPVDLQLPRETIQKEIEYSDLNKQLKELKDYVSNLNKKPVVNLKVIGQDFNRSHVYELINKCFKDLCLTIRPQYDIQTAADEKISSDNNLDIEDIVKNKLNNPAQSSLTLKLLDKLSHGDMDAAQETVDEFYENYQ